MGQTNRDWTRGQPQRSYTQLKQRTDKTTRPDRTGPVRVRPTRVKTGQSQVGQARPVRVGQGQGTRHKARTWDSEGQDGTEGQAET